MQHNDKSNRSQARHAIAQFLSNGIELTGTPETMAGLIMATHPGRSWSDVSEIYDAAIEAIDGGRKIRMRRPATPGAALPAAAQAQELAAAVSLVIDVIQWHRDGERVFAADVVFAATGNRNISPAKLRITDPYWLNKPIEVGKTYWIQRPTILAERTPKFWNQALTEEGNPE